MNERVLVMSLEDDERLGPGWYNSPKTAAKAAAEPAGEGGE
jgi:hypothetical protein